MAPVADRVGRKTCGMFYQDLSTECQADSGEYIRAVGWLGAGHPFTTGEVDPVFMDRLREHILNAWQPFVFMGCHACELCQDMWALGSRNVWIPTKAVIYVFPQLIVHYIKDHRYLPPQEFITAVMECPRQKTEEFFALLSRFERWKDAQRQWDLKREWHAQSDRREDCPPGSHTT